MDEALTEEEMLAEIAVYRARAQAAEAKYQESQERKREQKRAEKAIRAEAGRTHDRITLGPLSQLKSLQPRPEV